jgi:hypothetical protein
MAEMKMRDVCVYLTLTGLTGASFAAQPSAATLAPKPSFEGVWQIDKPVTMLLTTDGKAPPLKPVAKALYDQRIAKFRAGEAKAYDNTYICKPMGEPRTSYEGQPFDIVQGVDTIFAGYTWNRMVRFIYMQEKHGEILGPAYYGTGVGMWEGNTLVFDGVGFNDSTLLDAAGMPHSDALHIVQRLTLKDNGNTLVIDSHFEDAGVFSKAWSAQHTYKKLPGATIQEDICPQRLKLTIY